MHWIDWAMVMIPLVGVLGLSVYTQRYVKGVADYISAGRCAGRYLLTSASGESGSGVTNTVANVEKFMLAGFVGLFWDSMLTPVALLLAITGFVIYRYRQSRVLTLAQFFEERYSRNFRRFIGMIIFAAGGVGYIVFPLASCLFFKAFLGLPDHFRLLGCNCSTSLCIMLVYLSLTLTMICFGGQVTLMITDCVEGIFSHLAYLIIIFVMFSLVSWGQITDVLSGRLGTAAPSAAIAPNHSPIDPFDAYGVKDFNFFAVLLSMFSTIYLCNAWQGGHGFRSAAKTPHEGRMAGILASWRGYARTLVLVVIAICAVTYLRHPDFKDRTHDLKERIAAVPSPTGQRVGQPSAMTPVGSQAWFEGKGVTDGHGKGIRSEDLQRQKQQAPFMALADMLPVGVKGLLLVVMIMGLIAGDGSHIISWSSIFIQDCVLPWRRKPFTTTRHLHALRLAAIGLAVFAMIGSLFLPLSTPIWIWWAVTGGIYNGGAGAILIGGLYWSRGTVQAAWAAVLVSIPFSAAAIILSSNWFDTMTFLQVKFHYPKFISSGFWLSFFVLVISTVTYIGVSLATCRAPFNLRALLSRGADEARVAAKRPSLLYRLMGIDEHFTKMDKATSIFIFVYSMLMVLLVVVLAFWRYVLPRFLDAQTAASLQLSKQFWMNYWLILGLGLPGVIATVTFIWFSVGSVIDMRDFFRAMKTIKRDEHDDGTVVDHRADRRDRIKARSPLREASKYFAALAFIGLALLAHAPALAGVATRPSPSTQEAFPVARLATGTLAASVYLPDPGKGYYRGPRFDWSGLISRVEYQGHTFFAEWKDSHDPARHDDVLGPAEEFGMTAPLGYAQAKPGESFIKIGIGHLLKPDTRPYRFYRSYPLAKAAEWKVAIDGASMVFIQEVADERGFGYRYTKRVSLDKNTPQIAIAHTLRDTGKVDIKTDHYCHNFIVIDDAPIGPDYHVDFSFAPTTPLPAAFAEYAAIDGKQLRILKPVDPGKALYVDLGPTDRSAANYSVSIRNTKTGGRLAIAGDGSPTRWALYARKETFCPEPYIEINLAPGQETTWTTRYTFSADAPSSKP